MRPINDKFSSSFHRVLFNISDLALSIFLFIYENNLKMFLQVKLQHFLQSSALIWVVSRNVDSQVKIKYFNNNVNKNNLLVLLKSDTNVKTWNDVLIFLVINFKAILKKWICKICPLIKKGFCIDCIWKKKSWNNMKNLSLEHVSSFKKNKAILNLNVFCILFLK
jgi:hypothetical protein